MNKSYWYHLDKIKTLTRQLKQTKQLKKLCPHVVDEIEYYQANTEEELEGFIKEVRGKNVI